MNLMSQYEALISEKYPSVIFRDDLGGPDGSFVLDVFFIPDNELAQFNEFKREFLNSSGLQRITILPHSRTATLRYYPDIKEFLSRAGESRPLRMTLSPDENKPEVPRETQKSSNLPAI